MSKSFGDAFVIDLKTRQITCLTCSIPGAAFLRVMHMANGDYLLIGPDHFKDLNTSRRKENELWYLSKILNSKPVRLNQRMSEGAALSKKNLRISYTETSEHNPTLEKGASQMSVADIDLTGSPKLINRMVVYASPSNACTLEAQDFFDKDTKMTFTCYEPQGLGSAMKIDLKTSEVTNISKAPGTYNECEGIFPDGDYTTVEADRQIDQLGGKRGYREIDIWKLKLDGTGKDFKRITFFNDYEGWKASNPVISTDGKWMAFQIARTADEAGVGYGIMLHKLD